MKRGKKTCTIGKGDNKYNLNICVGCYVEDTLGAEHKTHVFSIVAAPRF